LGAPRAEGDVPRFDDGGSEPPGYESDPGRDDSSAGSALPDSGPTFGNLVDLNGPERCRVKMSLRGKTIAAVCRQLRVECGRRGHRHKTDSGTPIVETLGFTFDVMQVDLTPMGWQMATRTVRSSPGPKCTPYETRKLRLWRPRDGDRSTHLPPLSLRSIPREKFLPLGHPSPLPGTRADPGSCRPTGPRLPTGLPRLSTPTWIPLLRPSVKLLADLVRIPSREEAAHPDRLSLSTKPQVDPALPLRGTRPPIHPRSSSYYWCRPFPGTTIHRTKLQDQRRCLLVSIVRSISTSSRLVLDYGKEECRSIEPVV
jgi:hypothetical protein